MTGQLRVLCVASEIYPLVKTGGLGDVVGALPAALAREGVELRSLVPGYPAVMEKLHEARTVQAFAALQGGPARLLAARVAGLDLYVLEAPRLFARPGNPYVGPGGADWPDNAQRFAALGQVAAQLGHGLDPTFLPQVVHAHDWQAGLAPAYLHYGGEPRPGTVMTVHNLAFQGKFPKELLAALGLPARAWALDGVEYYGTIGFLKAGLALADRITTVSPTYAAEVRTPELGMGLDGVLRQRASALSGILNGIDEAAWNPAADPNLLSTYDAKHLARRAPNKAALQRRFGLAPDPQGPLFGVVSRLTWQKGMDVLLAALPGIAALGAQLALLGTGDQALETAFAAAAESRPGRVAAVIGYDEALAHLVHAGADALLVPSRFEPCGLTQLCAMRYGCVPVVARVGGLADTVVDASEMALAAGSGTGIQFGPVAPEALQLAVGRAAGLWRDRPAWQGVQRRAMATDVSWRRPAKRYAALYRELVASRAG